MERRNKLFIDVAKSKVAAFHEKLVSSINGIYSVNSLILEKLIELKHLGVIFDQTFSFQSHIDHLCTRSMGLVGILKISTTVFGNIRTSLKLYESLVLTILQYVSAVQSPYAEWSKNRLERVQHR